MWEHYDVVLPGEALGAAEPLVAAARDRRVHAAIGGLPGYNLENAGELVRLSADA